MGLTERGTELGARTFGIGSAVAVVVGVITVLFGDAVLTTVGVLAIIVGVVSLLFAVGIFLGN